jgi:hypothetical protein
MRFFVFLEVIMAELELHISKRLQALLPPLTDEERAQLKANIKADRRVIDPLLYWNDGTRNVVVEGMHRWEIIRGTDIPFRAEPLEFASYEEVEIWILDHALGKRNLLAPAAIRKIRGDLYNRLKRKDGGHGDQKSEYQNDTPIGSAAQKVAEKAGVSPATIKRDGARVEAISALTKPAQAIADKATDKEIRALGKLSAGDQTTVARAVRTGQAASVSEAIKQTGAKPGKEAAKPTKPPKQYPRSHWLKQWNQAIGPVVRLVDKIAGEIGEKRDPHHEAVQDRLNEATEEMEAWLK